MERNKIPDREQHCIHTDDLYGLRADELHEWIDSGVEIFGSGHRDIRHDPSFIPKKFTDRWGLEQCKQIILSHLILDKKASLGSPSRGDGSTITVKGNGTTHIPHKIFRFLSLNLPKTQESNRIRISYLMAPGCVLLYNSGNTHEMKTGIHTLSKMIDNLRITTETNNHPHEKRIIPHDHLSPSLRGTTHIPDGIRKVLNYPKKIPFLTSPNMVVLYNPDLSIAEFESELDIFKSICESHQFEPLKEWFKNE